RLEETAKYRHSDLIKPEMEWAADGIVMVTMMIPANKRTSEVVAVEIAKGMGLIDPEVINREIMQDAEGTRIELKGR
ncbi:OAM dimerization domain-containing protein, partial [Acinetobacter baumannii]|nr:OAM dimerization domain-containing protein [Acinetobacter baumannii]